MVFSGTAVAAGRGRAVVVATGAATELGKIAGRCRRPRTSRRRCRASSSRSASCSGIVVIAIAVVVCATILLTAGSDRLGAVDVLLLAVSLAVAAVPEGLTAITTIVLSLGMQRMAKRHVIVRKLSAVETLGSTTEICSDKTGTLTSNEMTVRAVVTASGRTDLTGTGYEPVGEARQDGAPLDDPAALKEIRRTLTAAALANNAALQEQERGWSVTGRPDRRRADRGRAEGRADRRGAGRSVRAGRRDPVLLRAQADDDGPPGRRGRGRGVPGHEGRARRPAGALHRGVGRRRGRAR